MKKNNTAYKVFKIIEADGVRYFFSRNAWKKYNDDSEVYGFEVGDFSSDYGKDCLLMYSTDFELI